jgi:natural product biosynthesis luciferase-like monooxygenase protein
MNTYTKAFAYPFAPMQASMLFHSLSPERPGIDIEQIVCTLQEPIDKTLFQEAWNSTLARHDALRTGLHWQDSGQPQQQVYTGLLLPFHYADWQSLNKTEQETQFKAFLEEDRRQGFDLSTPPAMRLNLFKLDDALYKLVWTVHHIILDGRAFAIVIQDVFTYYETLCKGERSQLPPAPSFKHFVDWLQRRDDTQDEAFWRQQLAGLEHVNRFDLPTPTQAIETIQSAEQVHLLPVDQTDKLKRFAQDNDITLNTLIQGAWALLLSRYTSKDDVVFGAVRACRKGTVSNAQHIAGVFINTLPVRAQLTAETSAKEFLQALRAQQVAVRDYEHTPLVNIQKWSDIPSGSPLFDSVVVFDYEQLDTILKRKGEAWQNRDFQLIEKTGFPITLYAYGEQQLLLKIDYDPAEFSDKTIARMLTHLHYALETLTDKADQPLNALSIMTEQQFHALSTQWNDTAADYPRNQTVHGLFEVQAIQTPDAIAFCIDDAQLSFAQLNARANQLAHYLISNGVQPEALVGVMMGRSLDMVIALLAVQKAGSAYVPLDPAYPRERLAFMAEDAQLAAVLTHARHADLLPAQATKQIFVDQEEAQITACTDTNPALAQDANKLTYVIYTSGSTGNPKGVMVTHRNVVNFFQGMDQRIGSDTPGTWLTVTSISFDISVLELFWTLTRGYKVVLYRDVLRQGSSNSHGSRYPNQPMDFSLFYWNIVTEQNKDDQDKYRLLMESAKYGDQNGFTAVWTPERHFASFGGLYPNPSVVSAALAVQTQQIQIRAGSCVLPLHSPIRVAEEWAVVDNLSNGRTALAIASGWQPNDFVIKPENHADAKTIMFESVETLKKLWRGETVSLPGPNGDVGVQILPRPIQAEVPIWITVAGNPDTFIQAGRIGANVLTHLLGQSVEQVAKNIALYRKARQEANHEGPGHVTLLLHTLVGEHEERVKELSRQPMKDYLLNAMFLVKSAAWNFPAFKDMSAETGKSLDEYFETISDADLDAVLEFAFERYYSRSGLFGTPERCMEMVDRLKEIGVNEIGCLIDYGIATETVLKHLPYLNQVRQAATMPQVSEGESGNSIPELIERHGVTHFQCTPSMARMLVEDAQSHAALCSLNCMMVGGEAFPTELANQLSALVSGKVVNMYGPTETTIWSTTHEVEPGHARVPIGRPIANTQIYVLDKYGHPAPIGVPGELIIGGDGVVRGYLNQPKLTAERFIDTLIAGIPTNRLYRTGDLVRCQEDGTLEFLGRIDHQVKIRGYRIELGEIEEQLKHHRDIHQAVVLLREDQPGDQQLVAYVIPVKGVQTDIQDMKNHLKQYLPEFMVPSTYVMINELPLTPNGKINYNALPEPAPDHTSQNDYVAPESQLALQVAEIWSDVLKIPQIGMNDNFFDLGGHSLTAVQVAHRIRQLLDIDFSLQTIFTASTLAGMIEKIEQTLLEQVSEGDLEAMLLELDS